MIVNTIAVFGVFVSGFLMYFFTYDLLKKISGGVS